MTGNLDSMKGRTKQEGFDHEEDTPADTARRQGMDESWFDGKHVDARDRLRPGFAPCLIGIPACREPVRTLTVPPQGNDRRESAVVWDL